MFSMLALFGVIAAGYQLGGAWTSILAGLLIAFSPIDIRYAQEIGQYSLYLCLGIWSANCYLLLQKDFLNWKYHAVWLTSTLAAVYTHYGAIIPIAAMYLLEALNSIKIRSWKRLGLLSITGILFLAGYPSNSHLYPAQPAHMGAHHSCQPALVFFAKSSTYRYPLAAFSHFQLPVHRLAVHIHTGVAAKPAGRTYDWRQPACIQKSFEINAHLDYLAAAFDLLLFTARANRAIPTWIPAQRVSVNILDTVMASLCLELFSKPTGRVFATLLIGTYLAISLISIPNISVRNLIYSQEQWPWPETNYEIRPTIDYWLGHRQRKEPIYVYYAGNTIFRYYLQVLNKENVRPPFNWTKNKEYYRPIKPFYVAYGKWLRDRPAEELSGDVLKSLPAESGAFWILFMHVHANEDDLIMGELLKTYEVEARVEAKGSTLYHLLPRQ